MKENGEVLLGNMSFTLNAMRGLGSSKSLTFDNNSFLLTTGTDAASENWAFVPTRTLSKETIRRAVTFFEEAGLPFIWPVLPQADDGYRNSLEEAGLAYRGTLTAMVCARPVFRAVEALTFEKVSTDEEANRWAQIAWQAFDSTEDTPASFAALARGLYVHSGFALLLAQWKGMPAGTCMLSCDNSAPGIGVYYFATLPGLRRHGVGSAMMNEIFRMASLTTRAPITLQATPAGLPFYAAHGFEALFKIPVHSFSADIF